MFARAREEFPGSVSLGAFEALTLQVSGRSNTAVAALLSLLADHDDSKDLNRYKPALRGNAEYLAGLGQGGADSPPG